MEVSRPIIKALGASDMVFIGVEDGKGIIESIIRVDKEGAEWPKRAMTTEFTGQTYDPELSVSETGRGGFLIYTNEGDEWHTMLAFLKAGDRIVPRFCVRAGSPALKEAGFNQDFLEMRVYRDQGVDKPVLKYTFNLDTQTYRCDSRKSGCLPLKVVELDGMTE